MAQRAKCRRVLRRKLTLKSPFSDHLLKTARISAQSQLAGPFRQLNPATEILGKMAPRAKCRRVLRRKLTLKSPFSDHLLKRARISAQSQLAGAVGQLNSVSEILGKIAQRAWCRRVLRRKLSLKSHFPDHLLK